MFRYNKLMQKFSCLFTNVFVCLFILKLFLNASPVEGNHPGVMEGRHAEREELQD